MFKYIKKHLRRFWKHFIIESEKYARWEHGRYDNGYYIREPKVLNCSCCKTDFQKHDWGLTYRCVYPEFVSDPVGIIEPKGIDSLFPCAGNLKLSLNEKGRQQVIDRYRKVNEAIKNFSNVKLGEQWESNK